MKTGYIIVGPPERVIRDATTGNTFLYCGLDRTPWVGVDNLYYAKRLPPDLSIIRARSFRDYVGNFSHGTVATLEQACRFVVVCPNADEMEVIAVTPLESGGLYEGSRGALFLGVDCYVDGYGSLIALGVFEKPNEFAAFIPYLNRKGLFDDANMGRKYSDYYVMIAKSAGLEPIETSQQMHCYAVAGPMLCMP